MLEVIANQALVTSGFSNWKKAIKRFKDHKHSVAYKNAVMKISASKDAIDQQLLREVENTWQQNLPGQLSALHYFLRQEIKIHNDHAGDSNLSVVLAKSLVNQYG